MFLWEGVWGVCHWAAVVNEEKGICSAPFLRMPKKDQPGPAYLGVIGSCYFILELGGETGSFFLVLDSCLGYLCC